MRIVLANTGHPATIKGGAEAAVLDLARRLAGRGHHVALVVHHPGPKHEVTEDRGVRVHALPNRNLYFAFDGAKRPAPLRLAWHALDSANPWMAAAFGRVLDEERPDVVNTHVLAGLSPLVWREARRRQVPIVHYLHEYGALCPRGSGFRDGKLCATPCPPCRTLTLPRKRLTGLVDTVVGVSRFTLDRHLAWGFFPRARRSVIPNIFEGLACHGRRARPDGPLRIGYFGRLIPDKGAHLLLQAVARLPAGQWTLQVAGTGDPDYMARLEGQAPAGTRFLGWARAETFLPDLDVLVVPSLWPDPQPRVVFEAYQYGVPVIGARSGGIPEQIDVGRTGWLFEAGSADALASCLRERITDRATLPPEPFRQRLAALDPDHVALLYENTYEEAIRRKASPGRFALAPALAEHTENG